MLVYDIAPARLRALVESIPPRARVAFLYYMQDDLTLEQIGGRLGISPAQALLLITRAVEYLEEQADMVTVH